jgi:(2Fe-2S) ferredoxin
MQLAQGAISRLTFISASPGGHVPYYKYHVFFCTNQREGGEMCCEQFNASEIREYAKARIKQLGMAGEGGVRINTAGCLDRCELGPVIVVYPEAVWYSYIDREDIDEIIDQHLGKGQVVERLLI